MDDFEERKMARRTPQEKKRLSYQRDCRYDYGNSPQAARKSVPWRKALRNRANRRYRNQQLAHLGLKPDETLADAVESRMNHRAPSLWTKHPDRPLGEVIQKKLEDREVMRTQGGRHALQTRYKEVWSEERNRFIYVVVPWDEEMPEK
jgi:hypothetical protein